MMMLRTLAFVSFALSSAGVAHAQSLALDKIGGGIPGNALFRLQGTPGSQYILLFSLVEQPTPLPALGITLAISDAWAGPSMGIPGFFGNLDAQGSASPSVAVPNEPGLAGLILPMQAIGNNVPPYVVSNLIRLTLQTTGTFAPALNSPPVPIAGGGTAVAPDGALLFVGGSGPIAQRYESRTEEWAAAGLTFGVGLLSQTTGLANGRVLFTGGIDVATGQPTANAAVYDPATQTTTTLAMGAARAGHGASLMNDGRVLVTGGLLTFNLADPLSLFQGIQATTEIFDPATNTFAPGPNMLEARAMHSSTTLTNGNVLIAGGLTLLPIVNIPTVSATAYRFNPSTNSFGLPAVFSGARFLHSATALSNGKVLLAGGLTLDLSRVITTGNILDLIVGTRTDCQVYTPTVLGFGTFATVTGMTEGRAGAAIAALPNGGALIAGGFRLTIDIATSTFEAVATATADRFAQGPNALAPTGAMAAPRLFPVAVNLPDGTIMVVGGGPANAEIYQY
jgi:hypothetical protein